MREVINNITGEIVELDDKAAETRALATVKINQLISDEVMDKIYMLQALKEAEEQLRFQLLPVLRAYYDATGKKTYSHEYLDLTYTKGHAKKTFNTNKFKEAFPQLYEEFCEDGYVKESVRIKVK